jgi:hypothetical protein
VPGQFQLKKEESFNFDKTLARLWQDFGKTLARLWQDFGKTLERLWQDFGKTLAAFVHSKMIIVRPPLPLGCLTTLFKEDSHDKKGNFRSVNQWLYTVNTGTCLGGL